MNEDTVARRIRAEFEEMPGMALTMPQASRLFGLDEDVCRIVVERLVDSAYLRGTERGAIVRAERVAGLAELDLALWAGRRGWPGRRRPRPTPSSFRSASDAGGSTA